MEVTQNRVNPLHLVTEERETESESISVAQGPVDKSVVSHSTESYFPHPQLFTAANEGPGPFGGALDASGEPSQEHLCRNVSLIYSRHEKLNLAHYIDDPNSRQGFLRLVADLHVLLDLKASRIEVIMTKLLAKMMSDYKDSSQVLDRLKDSIFTPDQLRQLNRTVQGIREFQGHTDYDQNWICAVSLSPFVSEPRAGIARLRVPANLNRNCQECRFVILIVTSIRLVGSRSEFENARIFGTLMSDPALRNLLRDIRSEVMFRKIISLRAEELASALPTSLKSIGSGLHTSSGQENEEIHCNFMAGVIGDLCRRLPHYWSDYIDGVRDRKSIQKTLSCTMLLYFICLLPSIAFGVLNHHHTRGVLTVEKVLLSQTFGGLTFALFGGTTQIVLLTTAPLAIYAQIVFKLSRELDVSFRDLYACVGLWNAFFLILYSVFGLSVVMQFSTRSSEEIFAFFISIAYAVEAFIATADNFKEFYYAKECRVDYNRTAAVEALTMAYRNGSAGPQGGHKTMEEAVASLPQCQRDVSILYLLLLLGTVWFGITLYNFTRTPYLTANKRELIVDYSLPIAVVVMTCFAYLVFQDTNISKSFEATSSESLFGIADLSSMTVGAVFGSMGLGFCLSLLFFMDQNISAAMVNNPKNKMKKGTSYHWDLMVVALINLAPSIFTFPMVHAALPHSPLHLRALADVEERVLDGHVTETVVRVRETRLAAIFSHLLIGVSVFLSSFLSYIPGAVLYGLFLYVAITPLYSNQMVERVLLFFTEEAAYPPTYYIRRVPQRKVRLFTLLQVLQLLTLCVFGFIGFSYLTLFFPVIIFLLIPFRHYCLPLIVDLKYIKALDYDL